MKGEKDEDQIQMERLEGVKQRSELCAEGYT